MNIREHRLANGLCLRCGDDPGKFIHYDKCRKYTNKHVLVVRRKHRAMALAKLGGKCRCKGCTQVEPLFMEVDHINGGGTKHRRENKHSIYEWLHARGFPTKGLRLLCANCNQGRQRNGGVCPRYGRRH